MKDIKFGHGILPQNRFEQFKMILKENLFDIFISGFYTFLFILPTVAWILFASTFPLFTEKPTIFSSLIIYGVLVLTITIQGLGHAGGFYYFRRLIYNEGSNVHVDFFKGIQKNGKSFSLIYFIFGLLYFFIGVIKDTLLHSNVEFNVAILLGIAYAIFFVVLMVLLFVATQSVFYTGTFGQFFKNGFKYTIGTILKTLPLSVLFYLPFILIELFSFNLVVVLIALGLCLIGIYGFLHLGVLLYHLSIYDETININQFKEIYRKGIQQNENLDK